MPDSATDLKAAIESLAASDPISDAAAACRTFAVFRARLTRGELRAAEKIVIQEGSGRWIVNPWAKQGILGGFRLGELKEMSDGDVLLFLDKDSFPARRITRADRIRVVPGGSSIREGAYV